MEIYFALLIPFIGTCYILLNHKESLVWWELLIPFFSCLLFIFIFKVSVETSLTSDTEYRGSIITHAQYYEPYDTWVHKTCTRTYKCGKSTCTSTYDCSYCDPTPAHYYVYDNIGNQYSISRDYYYELKKRWKANLIFCDLNRNINYAWGCGKDGDMYRILWNNDTITSDAVVNTFGYENRVQASHSVFSFPEITDEEAQKIGLYKYPEFYGEYNKQQTTILGLDSIKNYTTGNKIYIQKEFEYFNGIHGPKKHIKVFVLLFYNKPLEHAFKQEAYWDGGNDNELVVCINLDKKTHEILWVKGFSWTPNKRVLVQCRQEIFEQGKFSYKKILKTLDNILPYWERKHFEEFNYLTVDVPAWQNYTTYIVTFIITLLTCIWAVKNDIED